MTSIARLIDQFVPKNYQLSLDIDRPGRKFDGSVVISGTLQTGFDKISLHSKDLIIQSASVDGQMADFSHGDNDELIITTTDIASGEHVVKVDFSCVITDGMHGMYPCYFEHDGVKKELLATQFESHHAREVFPCIDEPAAKATFDVRLTTEPNVEVLGNMPIKTQISEGDRLVTTFDTTPIMSSYLLAWVIGDLQKNSGKTKSGVEVNIWSTPVHPINNLDFALDIATRTIDFFEDYFGVAYPLPKSDQVALPDFSSGAMENWGLITYRETYLLADPVTTSISNKQTTATVIAHELSHQWFGNLVTMQWWNDLWLNESFATLMEYIAIDAIEPDWDIWLDFDSYDSIAALRRDSLAGVQSVQTDVDHPDQISTLFDSAIVYAKGAKLLRMLRHYIGEEAFKTGLNSYFQLFAYQNTQATDLWSALDRSSAKDITNLMNRWISQPGFPVVAIDDQNGKITLSQERLAVRPAVSDGSLWPIPLGANDSNLPQLLSERSLTVDHTTNTPIRLNDGNFGHFITNYSDNLFSKLIEQVKSGELSTIDRLQLLNEQATLASAGITSTANLVPLLGTYINESTEAVWSIIGLAIGDLKLFTEDDHASESKLRQLALKLSASQYQRLGWAMTPGELEADTKLRSLIIGLTIYGEDRSAIDNAIDIYKNTPTGQLDPELRAAIFSVNVRYGSDESIIDSLIDLYKTTDSSELRADICAGLTATADPAVGSRLLDVVRNSSVIRTQDAMRWIAYLIRNKHTRVLAWAWIRNNWDWIKSTYAGDKSYDDYPRLAANAPSTEAQLAEYCDFFGPLRAEPALTRNIDMGITEIKNRIARLERDQQAVRSALLNL